MKEEKDNDINKEINDLILFKEKNINVIQETQINLPNKDNNSEKYKEKIELNDLYEFFNKDYENNSASSLEDKNEEFDKEDIGKEIGLKSSNINNNRKELEKNIEIKKKEVQKDNRKKGLIINNFDNEKKRKFI